MRGITKGPEPPTLTAHRQTPHCDYDNYTDKDSLRHALVTEQRGICCYCMGRIHNGPATMRIEHWRCQSHYPDEQLNYKNLLGACLGGDGQPAHLQHCDTRKADQDLRWNPADPGHHIETRARYEPDGGIRSDDAGFSREIEEVLNLNLPIIKNNRKGVLDAVLNWWTVQVRGLPRTLQKRRIEHERDRRVNGTNELEPYSQVAVWWLEQRLARMTA
ncbi:MAG: retron system putative HNH endonuclease [Phycisphaerales bacterium]